MKCPLFTMAEIAHEPELKPTDNSCLKEECAWWVATIDNSGVTHVGCAVPTIALNKEVKP